MPGGRQRVRPAEARALLQRLDAYVRLRYTSWPDFERKTKTPHATADKWRLGGAVPVLPQLLRLAKRDPLLDLHHLLTGRRATGWLRTGHAAQATILASGYARARAEAMARRLPGGTQ